MATSAKKPAAKKPAVRQAVSKSTDAVVANKAKPKAAAVKEVSSDASKQDGVNPVAKGMKPVAAVKPAATRKRTDSAPASEKSAKKAAPSKAVAKSVGKDVEPAPSKFTSTAATPGIKSALNPANAWPFPTGARPK